MPKHEKIEIIFVINGVDVSVEGQPKQKLSVLRKKALSESDDTGRPPDDWEIRSEDGTLLDPSKTLEELGLASGTRLFLTLAIGAGGEL